MEENKILELNAKMMEKFAPVLKAVESSVSQISKSVEGILAGELVNTSAELKDASFEMSDSIDADFSRTPPTEKEISSMLPQTVSPEQELSPNSLVSQEENRQDLILVPERTIVRADNIDGSLQTLSNDLKHLSTILFDILDINTEQLNLGLAQLSDAERAERFRSVTDENLPKDDGDDKKPSVKDILKKGGKQLGIAGMVMASIPLIAGFIEGVIDEIFGEESALAENLQSVFDSLVSPEALLGAGVGFLIGGPMGAIIGMIFGAATDYISDKLKEFGVPEDIANGLGLAFTAIVAAIAFKLKALTKIMGARMLKSAGANTAANISKAGATGANVAANAAAGTATQAKKGLPAPKAPPILPKPVAGAAGNLSDADLEKEGITKSVNKKGVTQYRDASGKFVGKEKLAELDNKGAIAKAAQRFPRIGVLAKVLGPIGALASVASIAYILTNDELSDEEKKIQVTKAVGGIVGGVGGAAAGAAIGTVLFPGVGTVIGGVLAGIGGGLAGDAIAGEIAPWIFGEGVDESKIDPAIEKDAEAVDVDTSGGTPDSIPTGSPTPSDDTMSPSSESSRVDTKTVGGVVVERNGTTVNEFSEEELKMINVARKFAVSNGNADPFPEADRLEPVVKTSDVPVDILPDMDTSASQQMDTISPSALGDGSAIMPSTSSVDKIMAKTIQIEQAASSQSGGNIVAPVINSGGNTTNQVGGSTSNSTTVNVFEDTKRILSNSVPIPMSSSWG